MKLGIPNRSGRSERSSPSGIPMVLATRLSVEMTAVDIRMRLVSVPGSIATVWGAR